MAARLLFLALVLAGCGHGPNFQAIPIGSPCKHDSDCGTQPYVCLLKSPTTGVEYPNGYCTAPCSTQVNTGTNTIGCPADSACIADQCRRTCASSATCREAEGYECVNGVTLGVAMAQFCDVPNAL